jgi:hypothetical protein
MRNPGELGTAAADDMARKRGLAEEAATVGELSGRLGQDGQDEQGWTGTVLSFL